VSSAHPVAVSRLIDQQKRVSRPFGTIPKSYLQNEVHDSRPVGLLPLSCSRNPPEHGIACDPISAVDCSGALFSNSADSVQI
jgi:hypothetical protein